MEAQIFSDGFAFDNQQTGKPRRAPDCKSARLKRERRASCRDKSLGKIGARQRFQLLTRKTRQQSERKISEKRRGRETNKEQNEKQNKAANSAKKQIEKTNGKQNEQRDFRDCWEIYFLD